MSPFTLVQDKYGRPKRWWRMLLVCLIVLSFAAGCTAFTLSVTAKLDANAAKTKVVAITQSPCSLAAHHPEIQRYKNECDHATAAFIRQLGPDTASALARAVQPYLK